MKQVNGTGSIVSGLAVLCAAACAECIPVMLGFVALAGGGVAWDMLRGNFTEIKKLPRRAGTQSRQNKNYIKYSIQQSRGKVKEGISDARI